MLWKILPYLGKWNTLHSQDIELSHKKKKELSQKLYSSIMLNFLIERDK